MVEQSRPAAGWFPQTDGRLRYWDGRQWTDQFQDAPPALPVGAAGSPGSPAVDAPAPEKKNWFLRHKIVTGLAAIALLAIAVNLGDGSNDEKASSPTSSSPTSSSPAASKSGKAGESRATPDKIESALKEQFGLTDKDSWTKILNTSDPASWSGYINGVGVENKNITVALQIERNKPLMKRAAVAISNLLNGNDVTRGYDWVLVTDGAGVIGGQAKLNQGLKPLPPLE